MTAAKKKAARKAKARRAKVDGKASLSHVQHKVVDLMSRPDGATKADLLKALPGSKEGYVSALLHRILKEKGVRFDAVRVKGERQVHYKIK